MTTDIERLAAAEAILVRVEKKVDAIDRRLWRLELRWAYAAGAGGLAGALGAYLVRLVL